MVLRRHGGSFIQMNRRTILQLTLAAVLILQAFAWTPHEDTATKQTDTLPDQLVYRVEREAPDKRPLRFSF